MQYQFDAELAMQYGVEEAIFVHRIYWWVRNNRANNRNYIDGRYWTYDSLTALASKDIFGFWSKRQLERIIKSCKEKGLILIGDYNTDRYIRPQWYTVTEEVMRFYEPNETVNTLSPNCDVGVTKPCCLTSPNGDAIIGTVRRPVRDQLERGDAPAREEPPEEGTPNDPEDKPIVCGEFKNVSLTQREMGKLLAKWPGDIVQREIEDLSCYMKSKRKKYADHYATLLNWLRRDYPDGPPKVSGSRVIDEEWIND